LVIRSVTERRGGLIVKVEIPEREVGRVADDE
jgi:hypothetical protein